MPRYDLLAALAASTLAGTAPAFADLGAGEPTPTTLYLRAGHVDAAAPKAGLADAIQAAAGRHFVIQLDGPITPDRRARLAAAGIRLGDYLPMHAYVARLDRADPAAVRGLEFIRWWSEYRPEWKLDPEIGKRQHGTAIRKELAAKGRELLTVVVFAGADSGAVSRAIFAIPGAEILEENAIAGHVELTVGMSLADAPRLASVPNIQYVEPAPEALPRNSTTRWIVQANTTGFYPLYANGLRGEGQVVGILDGRVDVNHCSFRDTVNPVGPLHRKITGMQTSGAGDFHGTHVSGTAVGDNGIDNDTRGIAYMGRLSWGDYGSAGAGDFNAGINFNRSNGATVHTNSWGNDFTTSYDALCRAIDEQTWNHEDDMICFAVTNGSQLKNPENAKNVLAVGNTQDAPTQTTICTGGAGPTSDGRRKPEIWAPGCGTLSASSGSGCGTTSATGTSMASPAIAGAALLVRQYFTAGYYPAGIPGGPSHTPSGALVRAVLMNTGQDLTDAAGGFQIPTGYPSVQEGWGRVRADDALYFPGDARKLLVEDVRNNAGLVTSDEDVINVNVLGSGQQLRITLTWTEPPAAAGAALATINDLDLVVEGPGGTFLGNVFNTATGQSVTGGAKDAKNNTEQVHISSPPVGPYTVRVRGGSVAQGTQGYALVVTGDIQPGPLPPLIVSLAGPVPGLVPPGQPFSVNVNVTPGSQNVVPGSPTAWHRSTGAGTFAGSPLVSLGGNSYRADFPAPSCGQTPQFYFTAQGDQGASAANPSSAPASFHSTLVGVVTNTTVLSQSFESGLPAGWSTTGLWNIGSACPPSGTCDGPTWAYYGQPSNCTYDNGLPNSGNLTAAPVTLPTVPPGGSIMLSYCSALETEDFGPPYDQATVMVNGSVVDTAPDSPSFQTRQVDLTAYAGQTVTLAWRFDTDDELFNDYRGWHVDNIRIVATTSGCTNPPQTCYPNCDGSTAPPILNVQDFSCFLTRYAAGESYANCDGSTAPPVLNVQDFSCYLTSYAAGCR